MEEKMRGCGLFGPGTVACALAPMTAELQARTLKLSIENATTGIRPIGPPPPEIAQLVTDTHAEAIALRDLARKVDCSLDELDDCDGWPAFEMALRGMVNQLEAWEPYL